MSIVLEYNIGRSETLHNAAIQIKFFGALGQLLFACSTRAAVGEPLTLAASTHISCHIPRLPLRSGIYTFTIWCTVGETLEDSVSEAGKLSVVEGDFFGTGRYPARDTGDFLVAHEWSVDGRRIS
jgi:lipopolysaccharide transport system ATP-binding protein